MPVVRKRLLRTAVQMIKLTATREITPGALGRLFWIPQVGFGIQAPSDHIPPRCRCSFFNTCAYPAVTGTGDHALGLVHPRVGVPKNSSSQAILPQISLNHRCDCAAA